jgi:hypothetical protein
VMARILLDLLDSGAGSGTGAGADRSALKEMTSAPVRGGGQPVGEIRPLLPTIG